MRRTGPTNIVIRRLIRRLKKAANENEAPIWDYLAELLEKPARRRIAVNLSKIRRYSKPDEIIVVPGKVLGSGVLDKPVTVAAISFSFKAIEKIKAAGGRILHLNDLLEENPRGSGVRVII
jgi:large subunit ribosomal protein L18e